MPLTTTRSFRVRYFECDSFEHLNNAYYVRYMQEAAFDASKAAGFDLNRYQQMNRLWLVHRTKIGFLRPIFYNDTVVVKTWVQDFRHSSSRRLYQFTLEGKETLVAQAYTDWVFIDSQTNQPAPIPPEMHTAFFPDGLPESFPKRDSFPSFPPPAKQVFKFGRRVEWKEIDSTGVVNNPCYLDYIAECGFQAISAFNWPLNKLKDLGFAIFLREIDIRYLQPAFYGDELEISTWVSDIRRVSATRHYIIQRKNDGGLIAQAHTLGVWVNLTNGNPIRIPDEMLNDFYENISLQDNKA